MKNKDIFQHPDLYVRQSAQMGVKMKALIKQILKSMTEKKGRFFLLITVISLSTALLASGMGVVDIILGSFIGPRLEAYENRDIIIHSADEGSLFYSDEGMKMSGIHKESMIKELYLDGQVIGRADTKDETMQKITVRGRNPKDIDSNRIVKGNLKAFNENACIISDRTAREWNLELEDTLNVMIGGAPRKLKVTAISAATGVFCQDTESTFTILMPYEYLSHDFGEEGNYNLILADSSEDTPEKGIKKFNSDNSLFKAEQVFDKEAAKDQLSGITFILYAMLAVLVVMSAVIIYNSFKLMIPERLSAIGCLTSKDSAIGKVKLLLYLESFLYGLLGALSGNLLGITGLHAVSRLVSPLREYGIYETASIKPVYLIAGALFAVILSLVSSSLPIRGISKVQAKDTIQNDVRMSKATGSLLKWFYRNPHLQSICPIYHIRS